MNCKIPNSRRIIIRETVINRTYLRTGSCPEGRLIREDPKIVYRLSTTFGQLQDLSRKHGFERAVKIVTSIARCRRGR